MALPKGAGSLRERVAISRLTRIREDSGRYTEIENTIGEFFAQVTVTQSKDNVIADQTRDLRTHEIIFRAGVDVQQGDIATWRGTRLDVRNTRPVGVWLIIDCVTRSV